MEGKLSVHPCFDTTNSADGSGYTVKGSGFLCNTMEANASLTLNDVTVLPNVSNESGNAGGLVGEMQSKATLGITPASITLGNVTASTNAGGLVGEAIDPTLPLNLSITGNNSTISSSGANAGGLVGSMTVTQTTTWTISGTIQNLNIIGSTSSKRAGSLFGELRNEPILSDPFVSSDCTITSDAPSRQVFDKVNLSGQDTGGLVGGYFTNDLRHSLIVENISVKANSTASSFHGGLLGIIGEHSSYVKFNNVTVSGSSPKNYGGMIGWVSDHAHLVEVGTVSVNASFADGGIVGGLVGSMNSGVLYISSNPFAKDENDVSGITLTNLGKANQSKRGWILGERGNTLVYTNAADWGTGKDDDLSTNDTGVWGQVLRVGGNDQPSYQEFSAETPNNIALLTLNRTDHTVTVKALNKVEGTVTVSSLDDFAAVALRVQLNGNDKGALRFADSEDYSDTVTFTITGNVNLDGTGLTGLTRDVNSSPQFAFNITGSISDPEPTITLPATTVYASGNSHDRQGLIGIAKTVTINKSPSNKLTVSGAVDCSVLGNNQVYAAGVIAETLDGANLTGVTCSADVTISGGGHNDGAYAGFIAVLQKNAPVSFVNCDMNGHILDNTTDKYNNFMAGYLARCIGGTSLSVTNCNLSGSVKKKTDSNNYTRIGGLTGSFYNGTYKVTIDGLTISRLEVSCPTATNTCGGLLGYEWMNVTATISGVNVTKSKLNAGNALFGGMVYKSSGIWKVMSGTGEGKDFGIKFSTGDEANEFTGKSTMDTPSGLLVSRGDVTNSEKGALYLEICDGGYVIGNDSDSGSSAVSVILKSGSPYFDEIVGKTENKSGNGIVSYATKGNTKIDLTGSDRNTYTNVTDSDETPWRNTQTRYYYNLDTFRKGLVDATVDSPEKMVLMSAGLHCNDNLKSYFLKDKKSPNKITGDLDLTGYSYYPVPLPGDLTIENAAITFDYENLQNTEADNFQPTPSNENHQHKGMHLSLFDNAVKTDAGDRTLTVNGLTLAGSVGKAALIGGEAKGNSGGKLVLNLNDIKLDGLYRVFTVGNVAPLLIETIPTYVTLNLNGLTTQVNDNKYATKQTSEQNADPGFYAGSSLIGNVGGENTQGITLDFKNIKLDGREKYNKLLNDYGTHRSIFKNALLLQSFQYATGCSGEYTFVEGDYPYTLGQELSNNADSQPGRNNGEQYNFFKTSDPVYLAKDVGDNFTLSGNSPESAFASGFLRYVAVKEGAETNSHEIDINLTKPQLAEGCGTYSDPYRISDANTLFYVSQTIAKSGNQGGFTVNLNVGAGGVITAKDAYDLSMQNGHVKNDVANQLTADAATWYDIPYTQDSTTSTWKPVLPDGLTEEQKNAITTKIPSEISNATILEHLRSAYYVIEEDLVLPSVWNGLGEETDSQAFQGVIVGGSVTTDAGTRKRVITVENNVSIPRFGGLIKYSLGSVVKNLTIQYNAAPNIKLDEYFNTLSGASFFGGVVGCCMGGDTIIDDVTVTFADDVVPTTTTHLAAIGGYVGLVGGSGSITDSYGGGVVFRGDISSSLTTGNFADVNDADSNAAPYLYCNPYVGRVLDGYAMKEGDGGGVLGNNEKNYEIPVIPRTTNTLSLSGSTISVSNAADLWLLSAIVNSGAADGSKAYSAGKARTCDYDKVGDEANPTDWADDSGTSPYLIAKHTAAGGSSFLSLVGTAVSIQFANGEIDVSSYGNGFRGIGASYGTSNTVSSRMLTVSSVTSSGSTIIKLGQNRREYTKEKDGWTTLGTGLFTILKPNPASDANSPVTIQNLSFTGTTGITYYGDNRKGTNNPLSGKKLMDQDNYRLGYVSAGMLAGTLAKSDSKSFCVTLENISLSGNVTGQATFAGGLIGLACINKSYSDGCLSELTVKNCSYSNLNVSGYAIVGGLLGYAYADTLSILPGEGGTSFTGTNSISSMSTNYGNAKIGVGSLMGRCNAKVLTIGEEGNSLNFTGTLSITSKSTAGSDHASSGSIGGMFGIQENGSATIQNIHLGANVTITNSSINTNSGGLVGVMGYYNNDSALFNDGGFTWTKGGVEIDVSNVHVAQGTDGADASLTVATTGQGGGLFGALMAKNATIYKLFMGDDHSSVTVASCGTKDNQALGGVVGISIDTNLTLKDVSVQNTRVWRRIDSTKTARGTGLLVGYIQKGSNGVTIRNAKIKDCMVAVDSDAAGKHYAGFLYGYSDNNPVKGYNILIENSTIGLSMNNGALAKFDNNSKPVLNTDTGTPNDTIGLAKSTDNGTVYTPYPDIGIDVSDYQVASGIGIFGGYTSNTTTLVGVSLQGCNTPAKDFGIFDGGNSTGYAIRADYSGMAGEVVSNVTLMPELKLNVSGIETLTGDGVGLVDGRPVGQKIVDSYDAAKKAGYVYFNVPEALTYLHDRLSTYETSGENTYSEGAAKPRDFPVLEIATTDDAEANKLIAAYISALTNHKEYSVSETNGTKTISKASFTGVLSIDNPITYRWNGNTFKPVKVLNPSEKNSLTYDKTDKKFSITKGSYDNQKNQFTLITVTYDDPTKVGGPFTLHIPVMVKKVMKFKFWAEAEAGTSYYDEAYGKSDSAPIVSHGEQITARLTYEYQRTKKEWQDAIDNGEDLLWNFEKELDTSFPADTRLTLVDRNNNDKAYFCTVPSEEKLNFQTAFDFTCVPLCDLLKLKEAETKSGCAYIPITGTQTATLRYEGVDYRPANPDEKDDSVNATRLKYFQVGLEDSELVQEQYFLTVQTPKTATDIVNTALELRGDKRLTNPSGHMGLPTEMIPAGDVKNGFSVLKKFENRIIFGNFFTQTVNVTSGTIPKIDLTNNQIEADVSATIRFNDDTDEYSPQDLYNRYRQGQPIHLELDLYLKEVDGSDSFSRNIVKGTVVDDTPLTEAEEYHQVFQVEIGLNSFVDRSYTANQTITLRYDNDALIQEQFPLRASDSDKAGIQLWAQSILSNSQDGLTYSSNRADGSHSTLFYREDVNQATLSYSAKEEVYSTQRNGWCQLGINGRDEDDAPFTIQSAAQYDVSALEDASSAQTLDLSLLLSQKNDGGAYDSVVSNSKNLSDYFDSVTVSARVVNTGVSLKGTDGRTSQSALNNGLVRFTLPENFRSTDIIEISVDYVVYTGNTFEEKGNTYANYKVLLTAELGTGTGSITGSNASDYIIYTNAKINPMFVS